MSILLSKFSSCSILFTKGSGLSNSVVVRHFTPPPPYLLIFSRLWHLKKSFIIPSAVIITTRWLLFILKKSNTPLNTFLRKNTATPTITDNTPSLRATSVIAGNDPQHHSRRKKNVKQPTSTITDKAPSLRAMRVIAGNDPQTTATAKKTSNKTHPSSKNIKTIKIMKTKNLFSEPNQNIGIILALAIITAISVLPQQSQAGRYYVGFSGTPAGATAAYTGDNAGLISALSVSGAADTVFIAKGVTFYLDDELTVNEHIIGGCNPAGDGIDSSSRTAIGAANSVTGNMTVLDGNSLRRTLRSSKHRVATVASTGIIENCLIRNGHARGTTNAVGDLSGYGGGILLDGGKLYNCIVRGNVAMNVAYKATNPSKGGGIYIISGEILNCIVAFNMDDDGAGIDGNGGEVVNSTIARNSNTPSYARIEAGQYQPFNGNQTTSLLARYVYLDAFYIATTETTSGQYACFMAAIDYGGTTTPYLKSADASAILSARMPTEVNYTGYPNGITVRDYAVWSQASTSGCTTPSTSCWNLLSNQTNLTYGGALTANSNIVWYPNTDKSGTTTTTGEERQRDNYPISCVSWYGSLCFSLWLGGSLPTESQWEYAARQKSNGSTDNSYYYAGATANTDAGLSAVGWYNGNSGSGGGTTTTHAHEVGKKAPTGKGLYDMSGNLWDWVIDPYAAYSTAAGTLTATSGKNLVSSNTGNAGTSFGAPLYNPVAFPSSGSDRVNRGGSWNRSATDSSLGSRGTGSPSYMSSRIGIRPVVCP